MFVGQQIRKLVVQIDYDDADYRALIRTAMQTHYWELRSEKKTRGSEAFFDQIVTGRVAAKLGDIYYSDGSEYAPDFERIIVDRTKLNDFLRIGASPNRRFQNDFLALVDAYLQIERPGFDIAYRTAERSGEIGKLFGFYLMDESALLNRANQALNVQRILGIYQYDDVDTHLNLTGESRYLALFAGQTNDYIDLLDVPAPLSDTIIHQASKTKLMSGFCIPGQDFSLVVLKSLCFRQRQIGLLYSAGSLINSSGGVLDDLSFETFTTDKMALGGIKTTERYGDPSFIDALSIHYGPKKRRALERITQNDEFERIKLRIDRIRRRML